MRAEQDAGERGCVGVTTGQLLCACVGSRVRAEYTVFGDAINLAARLMVTASKSGQAVLCDFRTRELACAAASYIALEPMAVKVLTEAHNLLLPPNAERIYVGAAQPRKGVTGVADIG